MALDIDGTLADYHSSFLGFASAWLGVPPWSNDPYKGAEPFRDWFCDTFGVDLSTFRAIKLAYRQGGMKRMMSMYFGAPALTKAIREAGAELWLTTTRPHDRFDRVDPDTREWLRRSGIEFDGLIYSDRKMEELAERVDPERVCFVLDDLVDTLDRAERLFGSGVGVLRGTRYNEANLWPVVLWDLLDARAVVTAHIQDWLIAHQFDELPTTGE